MIGPFHGSLLASGQLVRVEVTPHLDEEHAGSVTDARSGAPVYDGKTRNLEREYRAVVEELLELRGDDGRIAAFLRSITEPGTLADTSGYSPDISYEDKVDLLETLDVTERLEKALDLQRQRLTELQVRQQIRDDVQSGADKQQREYFLRKQMESIRKELDDIHGVFAARVAMRVTQRRLWRAFVRSRADIPHKSWMLTRRWRCPVGALRACRKSISGRVIVSTCGVLTFG